MKIKLFFTLALVTLFAFSISAQTNVKQPVAKQQRKSGALKAQHQANMVHAIKFLKRTNKVIVVAHNAVKKGGNKTGDLAKAIHHQRFAKKLLKVHKAHRAVQHSRVARKYAMLAIRNNKGQIENDWNVNAEEKETLGATISDAELEKDLKADNPNLTYDDSKITDKDLTEMEVIDMDPGDYKNE